MPDAYTTSGRFLLMGTGENNNTWGNRQNVSVFQLMDDSVFGWVTKALTGDYSLTTADGSTSEARKRMFKFTGAVTATVTVPAVSAPYIVWNATTGVLTFTNGSTSVTVQVGEVVQIITDGSAAMKRVVPTDFGSQRITSVGAPTSNSDAATKKYVDDAAFAGMSGTFPGQAGNAGKFLTTDGTGVSWDDVSHLPAPTITGGMTLSGSTKQNVTAVAAAALDLSASDWFTKSISSNTTFTFTGATASKAQGFVLDLTISSAAVPTWPAAVKWSLGTAPTLGNGRHIIGFITDDGGTTYVGKVGMQAVA